MRKLAAWCHDRRRLVIGLWTVAFVVLVALWATAAGQFANVFTLPGTESQRTYDLLQSKFPAQSGDTASVVFAVKDGKVLDEGNRAPINKAIAENTLKLDGQGGVQVALGGDVIHWSTAEQGGAGELFGILVAALVLFLTLGVVAMGLPLLNALFAMGVSLALMGLIGTRLIDVTDWTPQLAAMIGIGVGIDYALLILNRFRLERGAGKDSRDATLVSLDTSGRAVLFAGIVVVIAMLGMILLGISFLYGPAIGAALSVAATMTASLTLIPALLGAWGGRIKPAKG